MTTPVWFITAASSGFGREIALQALQRGHTVVATARNADRIAHLRDAGAHTLALDVTADPATLKAVADDVIARFGRVDYLINAAGYILDAAIEEATPKEIFDAFNTNVFGAVATIKAFLPHLRAQPPLDNTGTRATLVAFGSLGSWIGGPTYGVYAMTKWSCSALMESLAAEVASYGIRATVVEPGYFRTGFLNPGAKVVSKERLPAYEDPSSAAGQVRAALLTTDGNQPGDVVKGGKTIVDILTGTGVAEGKKLPVRIVLGTDCEETIRGKIKQTEGILEEWKDVIRGTDY
ncbi:unnamed protein product [Clonostachys rhizophaga]|uniref:Uncharacterized protein n=2 Tax=Clonostachys TaxID=110564 RepID=A0A9N9V2W8_9HYPO|nr:unnamed protein product [Clonostachys rhizophaga]CAI6090269.1 unnamed protein product [Clonostachys chloroleuca]